MEPIAVIGFSLKMPEEVIDEDSLWEVLESGRNLMTEWPEDRLYIDGFNGDAPGRLGAISGRGACFVKEDPATFDAPFFSVMPREANSMDPQQRWLLETSYHAFENAGLSMESIKNTRMAVFEASMSDDYVKYYAKDPDTMPASATTGNAACTRPNRVSWHFGLLGPSIHIDTACSGSLVAMDLACQSIHNGDADSALVLGDNLILGPELSLGLSAQGFLSPSSVCHSFDHRADGYGRGEGIIGMVIKPLSSAIANGDMIRAVIRGTGGNADGHTPSMTQPSTQAQERLIRQVYAKSGLDFEQTRYIEAHGTGTPIGDPIEFKAIGRVFRTSRTIEEPLYIGSIKANLGHLEGAAGLAGIVKAILMLERGMIPPNALFEKLNPDIDAEFYHAEVPTRLVQWPSTGVRRASVNSFGMGGANAHVVLDDALSYLELHKLRGTHQTKRIGEASNGDLENGFHAPNGDLENGFHAPNGNFENGFHTPNGKLENGSHAPNRELKNGSHVSNGEFEDGPRTPNGATPKLPSNGHHGSSVSSKKLLVWSANDEAGLGRVTEGMRSYCSTKLARSRFNASDLAYTLAARRSHLPWRTFATVDEHGVEASLGNVAKPMRAPLAPGDVAFIFTGQGAQYVEMGLELLQFPDFKSTLDQVNSVLKTTGCTWDVVDELHSEDNINKPEYSQPLCTALQLALTDLLKALAILPVATVGHSSGEIAAAYAAGAISLEAAVKISYYRGQAAGKLRSMVLSSSPEVTAGAMMAVNLGHDEAEQYVKRLLSEDADAAVTVACINSPANCTLSGPEHAIDALKNILEADGVLATKLSTGGMAYHSPAMQAIASSYLKSLKFLEEESLESNVGSGAYMLSSVTGVAVSKSVLGTAQYWVDNLVSPVQFFSAVGNLLSGDTSDEIAALNHREPTNIAHLVEVGPTSALRRPILEILKHLEHSKDSTARKKSKNLHTYSSVLSKKKSSVQTVLELVGQMFCSGQPVSVLTSNQRDPELSTHLLVDLPGYPFDHSQQYWEEPRLSRNYRLRRGVKNTVDGSTALLGKPVPDSNPTEPRWRTFLSSEAIPWIGDHIIDNINLLSGTCMMAMAMEAAKQNFMRNRASDDLQIARFFFKEVRFMDAVVIAQSIKQGVETHLQMYPLHKRAQRKDPWQHEIKIFTCTNEDKWTECFNCTLHLELEKGSTGEVDGGLEKQLEEEQLAGLYRDASEACTRPISATNLYRFMNIQARTIYGTAFALLEDIHWDGAGSSTAKVNLLASSRSPQGVLRHPVAAVLDAAAHLTAVPRSRGISFVPDTLVLSGLRDTWISAKIFLDPSAAGSPTTAHLLTSVYEKNAHTQSPGGGFCVGVDENESVLFSVGQIGMTAVSASTGIGGDHDSGRKMLYGIEWKPQLSLMSSEALAEHMSSIPVPPDTEDFMKGYWPMIESALIAAARKVLVETPAGGLSEHFARQLSSFSHYYTGEGVTYLPARTESQKQLSSDELEALLLDCEQKKPDWKLLTEVARNLKGILSGEADALSLMFDSGLADEFYASIFEANFTSRLQAFLGLASHENRDLKILEVGGGTGAMTQQVLSSFKQLEEQTGAAAFAQYTFTDISPAFFVQAGEKFHDFESRMDFKTLNLELGSHDAEGFQPNSYDVILASSALHVTENLEITLRGLKSLLKPNGYLIFMEIVVPECALGNVAFGVLPGWWLSTEEWRKYGPLINETQWDQHLREVGFSGNFLTLRDYESDLCHFTSIIVAKNTATEDQLVPLAAPLSDSGLSLQASSVSSPESRKLGFIIDHSSSLQQAIAERFIAQTSHHAQIFSWYEEMEGQDRNRIVEACANPDMVLVSLLEIGGPFLTRMSEESFHKLQGIISEVKNLLWVTGMDIKDAESPLYSTMKGFLRVMRAENLGSFIVTLEIESPPDTESATNTYTDCISTVIDQSFSPSPGEVEWALRDGLLHTWRLVEDAPANTAMNRLIHPSVQEGQWRTEQPLQLSVETPGVLDSIAWVEDVSCSSDLKPDEVEIEGQAWPLSFRDLLTALGRLDYQTPGLECAGVITRVGSAVNESLEEGSQPWAVGDRVVLCMSRRGGTLRTHLRATVDGIYRISDNVSFEAAAAALNPAMTAYLSLINLARLQKGERILIHSAAGSTGQMAVGIAKMIGAEIFATVGHDSKKKFLAEEFGIPEDHIFYSRDTSFSKGVLRMTGGTGVDVVLNSLAGDALRASWECVAPFGRFVELGKADIMSNASLPMLQFACNTSFFAVDLHHIGMHNTALYHQILKDSLRLLDQGLIRNPHPIHCYPISQVETALRFLQSGKSTGRIVVTATDDDVVTKLVRSPNPCNLDPDASYLIVGGLGGIGRAIIAWMVDKGAKNIITFSRSGLNPEAKAAQSTVAAARAKGANILTVKCDVSSRESLPAAIQECSEKMPPIKGCINSAMDIHDAPFISMNYNQWRRSLQSKVDASWNLDQEIPAGSVDFFILLSSLVGIYGPIAQSNYAAGCTVQDAIARKRAQQGENAVAVNLGWVRSVGIAVDNEKYQMNRMNQQDMQQVETDEILAVLSMYCQPDNMERRQVLVGAVTPADFVDHGLEPIHLLQRHMFSGFGKSKTGGGRSQGRSGEDPAFLFKEAKTTDDKREVAVRSIRVWLARALGVPEGDVETTKLLSDYGVDSLMAVELRNWVGKVFNVNVPVFDITSGISIALLGERIANDSKE